MATLSHNTSLLILFCVSSIPFLKPLNEINRSDAFKQKFYIVILNKKPCKPPLLSHNDEDCNYFKALTDLIV